jgi:hypothetical protein
MSAYTVILYSKQPAPMRATKCPYTPDTFIVTATNGRRYTVKNGEIFAHRYSKGSVMHVGVLDPIIVTTIRAAVAAAAQGVPA